MRPKGFGKNYFTFSSVLAYSVQITLQRQVSAIYSLLFKKMSDQDEDLEEEPPDDILQNLSVLTAKPCHCNCFYKLKTRLALLITIFIPRCPFYTVCFACRRTGVHPPL